MLSTIGTDLILNVLTEEERAHIEYGVSPATSEGSHQERLAAALKIWFEIFSAKNFGDIKHRSGNYKIMKRSTVNFLVAAYLNALISKNNLNTEQEIITFLKGQFQGNALRFAYDLETIAKQVMGDKMKNADTFAELYEDLERTFTSEKNIKKLLRINPSTSKLELYWNAHLATFIDSHSALYRDDLPANIYHIILSDGHFIKERLADGHYKMDGGLFLAHDESGDLFVMKASRSANLYYEENVGGQWVKRDIFEGFIGTASQREVHGVFLTSITGNYLLGQVKLETNQFSLRLGGESWYKSDEFIKDNVKNGLIDGHFILNYYRGIAWITGSKCSAMIQAVESNIYPSDRYVAPVPVEGFTRPKELIDEVSFINNDYIMGDLRYSQEIARAEFEMRVIFREVEYQIKLTDSTGILPIDDSECSRLNSFMQDGVLRKGPNLGEIQSTLERILGNIDYSDKNGLIYKILNLEFVDKTSERVVKNTIFRNRISSPLKPWVREIVSVFQEYDPIIGDRIDLEITQFNNFLSGLESGLSPNDQMEGNDWLIGQELINLLVRLFGSYTVKKIMTGNLFISESGAVFTVHPWRSLHAIYRAYGVSLNHMDFLGKIGERLDRGPNSLIKIQKFIIGSLISPWSVGGEINKIEIKQFPSIAFFPEFNPPTDLKYLNLYFSQLNDYLYGKFLDYLDDSQFYEKDIAYNKIASILVKLLRQQIYRSFLSPTSNAHLSKKDILRYQKLAIECVYDCLYCVDTQDGIALRKQLYSYIASGGAIEIELDFSIGRGGHPFGAALNYYEQFYKIILDQGIFNSYFFDDNHWGEMANSIPFSVIIKGFEWFKKMGTSKRFLPHTLLEQRKDIVIDIALFLKSVAEKFGNGEPIRIYGFNQKEDGYGSRRYRSRREMGLPYHPKKEDPYIDPDLPGSNDLYYEIDPNNFDSFSLKDFRIFLGALFADHQGFFIRTSDCGRTGSGTYEDPYLMEYLYAFDLSGSLKETISPVEAYYIVLKPYKGNYVTGGGTYVYEKIVFKEGYAEISGDWSQIIQRLEEQGLFCTINRFSDIKDWHSYLKLLPLLNERSSSFSRLG